MLLTKEDVLKIFFETEPTARSPYKLYGNPPMWEMPITKDGMVLFARPAKTQVRLRPYEPYREVDGISYQWQKDGKWIGQGVSSTFEDFLDHQTFCR